MKMKHSTLSISIFYISTDNHSHLHYIREKIHVYYELS